MAVKTKELAVKVTGDVRGMQRALGTGSRSSAKFARDTERDHRRVGKSFAGMASGAAKAAIGIGAAYVGIAAGRKAITTTEELAKSTAGLTRAFGLSTKKASEWTAVATARGMDPNQLSVGFTKLSKSVVAYGEGAKPAVAAFKSLGISQAEVKAGQKDFQGLLGKTMTAFGNMKGGTDKAALAATLFGKSYKMLLPLLQDGAGGFAEQARLADKYGVTLNGKSLKSVNDLIAAQREMKFAQMGLSVAFTEKVAPALLKVVDAGGKAIQIFRNPDLTSDQKWRRLSKLAAPLIKGMEDGVSQALPKMADAVAKAAPHMAGTFVKGFMNAGPWGKLVIGLWLVKKFGGMAAFTAIGRRAGAAVGIGIAEGAATGAAAGKVGLAGRFMGSAFGKAFGAIAVASILAQLAHLPKDWDPLAFLHPDETGGKRRRDGTFQDSTSREERGNRHLGRDRHGISRAPAPRGAFARGGKTEWEFDRTIGAGAMVPVTAAQGKAMREFGLNAKDAGKYVKQLHAHARDGALVKYVRDIKGASGSTDDLRRATRDVNHAMKDAGVQVDHFGNVTKTVGDHQEKVGAHTAKLADQVGALRGKLGRLSEGSTAYNATAAKLTRKQDQLTAALGGTTSKAPGVGKALGTIADNAAGMGKTFGRVVGTLVGQTNKVLAGFGAKKINIGLKAVGSGVADAVGAAGGGWVGQRGQRGADNRHYVLGDGEAILNSHHQAPVEYALRNTFGAGLDDLFATEQRSHGMAKGGRTGSRYSSLLAAANRVSAKHYPYRLGGGHEQPAHLEPFDCSGAVSYVTQQAGYNVPTTVSGNMGSWGFPHGGGAATIFYNGGHTFMRIGGRYWGTSGFARPGGGAGWFNQSPNAGYLGGFSQVHLPDLGAPGGAGDGTIAGVKITGPNGPLKSMASGGSKAITKAANAKLRRELAKMGAGAGQGLEGGSSYSGPLNKVFPRHNLGQPGVRFSPSQVRQIARGSNLPLPAFEQIAHGESDYHPGIIGHDPGGTLGYGLWQNTTSVNGSAFERVVQRLGGWGQQLNPVKNAIAAKWLYNRGGLSHWFGTKYLRAGRGPTGRARGGFVGGRRMAAGGYTGRGPGAAYQGPYYVPPPELDQSGLPRNPRAGHKYKKGEKRPYRIKRHGHVVIVLQTPKEHERYVKLEERRAKQAEKFKRAKARHAATVTRIFNQRTGRIVRHALGDVDHDEGYIDRVSQGATDASSLYSLQERGFTASHEDLTTEAGRATRHKETLALIGTKVSESGALQHEQALVRKEAAHYANAIRKLKGELKRKGMGKANRARGKAKLRELHARYVELQRRAKELGFEIANIGLDIQEIQNAEKSDIAEANPQAGPPTLADTIDTINLHEQAGDISATDAEAQRHAARAWALGGGFGSLSEHDRLQIRADDKGDTGAQDAAKAALEANTAALKELADAQLAANQLANNILASENYELTKSISDILGGYIVGSGVAGRSFTAGIGTVGRY